MTERPILCNAEMVRAILDGRKTQARRVAKTTEGLGGSRLLRLRAPYAARLVDGVGPVWSPAAGDSERPLPADRLIGPYGRPGDLLWVRETWQVGHATGEWGKFSPIAPSGSGPRDGRVFYRADYPDGSGPPKWRSSSNMPKWATRIWLRVTDVRVERVQEITEADILSEGITDDSVFMSINKCAKRLREVPEHWITEFDASISYCRRCAERKIRELLRDDPRADHQLDGGWLTESDSSPQCESCGRQLEYSLTEYGCEQELDHFESHGVSTTIPSDCHSLQTVLQGQLWDGNARLQRVAWQAFWDSINAKRGFGWDANPWVWVVSFERIDDTLAELDNLPDPDIDSAPEGGGSIRA